MRVFAVLPEDTTIHDLEVPTPSPEGRQVLLKVVRAGVCHTDTHLRAGGYDLGSRGMMKMKDRGIEYPMVLGHEVVGVVEKVGDDVESVRVGDVRLVYPWIGCGACRHCRSGHDNRCAAGQNLGVARHGGYAEYILVPDEKYLVDIGGLEPSWAATLACAVDVAERNLSLARDMGASSTVLSSSGDTGDIRRAAGGPASAVIDFVNNGVTAASAFEVLAKAGIMIQVGLFGGEVTLPTALLALRMIRIEGSFVGTLAQMQDLVRIAQRGELPHIPVLERTLSAAGVSDALDDLTAGAVAGRIVLTA